MNSEFAASNANAGLQGRVMLLPWFAAGMGGGRGGAGMTGRGAEERSRLSVSPVKLAMVVSTPEEIGWSPASDWG